MNIRPYCNDDCENVRYVCLNADGPCRMSKRGKNFILNVYCNYFIEKEAGNCFVAADENGKAIGYILCAENFDRFYESYVNEYVTRLKKYEFSHRRSAFRSIESQQKYKEDYPAHLHIDILPEYQHMGLGRKLMDALCNHLRDKGVKGIVLTVWKGNDNARRFYEKYGFTLIETKKSSVVYALKLT
ncbi:MAG: GNAT family N-acetyltransferase [Clostridia bacterium]|nr:GNAT family N-acetyltransferase [Clostridia bacterium]